MLKEDLKKELQDVDTLYLAGVSMTKGLWSKFNVYYLKNNEIIRVWIDGEDVPGLWVKRHQTKSGAWVGGYFYSSTIGTERVFEITYNISYWLFDDDGYHFESKFLSR